MYPCTIYHKCFSTLISSEPEDRNFKEIYAPYKMDYLITGTCCSRIKLDQGAIEHGWRCEWRTRITLRTQWMACTHRTLYRGRKWPAGNFIANSFPKRTIKSHPPKFPRMRIKPRLDFPENVTLPPPPLSYVSLPRLSHLLSPFTIYENVTFSCPTRALAHTVPLCNGPWTNIDQQLVESLPRPAAKRHRSSLDSQDLRIPPVFFSFYFHFRKSSAIVGRLCVLRDVTFSRKLRVNARELKRLL